MPAASGSDLPLGRVGIVGLGLIGGSIALRLRQVWPAVRMLGVDRPAVADAALARGVIDEARPAASDLRGVDLIVLATPVADIIELVAELGRAGMTSTVTDVGSTKRRVMAAADAAGLRDFVGGHPMAGSARGGLDAARAGLFAGRPWFLTPGVTARPDARARVEQLVRALGATVVAIEADAHDRTMAYVSHLPQLLSVVLMVAAGESVGEPGLAHSGRGLDDMTRLASSPPAIWEGILDSNADYVAEALRRLLTVLPPTVLVDSAMLRDLFSRANQWRDRLEAQRGTVHE
ncbi:MAG: prephenate dehydrogenase [Vicinamibacterales bacterium]